MNPGYETRHTTGLQASQLKWPLVPGPAVAPWGNAARGALLLLFLVLGAAANLATGQPNSPYTNPSSEDIKQLLARGDYDAADRLFAAELTRHPGDFRLLHNRALAHYLGGHPEQAREILLTVAPADRVQTNYQTLLASVFTRLGNYQEALPPAQEAAKLAPSDPENWLRLGALYLRVKRGQQATDVYREGRSLFPARPEFLLGLGVVEQMQAKFPEAIEIYRQATDAFPRLDAGYLFLASAQLKAARPAEARAKRQAGA